MNNLHSIYNKLMNGGQFAYSKQLEPGYTGVIVTKHNIIPAKYRAKVVYWLDRIEQQAMFVPRHRLARTHLDVSLRVPVTIWAMHPDGSERLCESTRDLIINVQLDRKLRVDGDISSNALGLGVVRYNNRFYAQELYSTVTKPGWHGVEIRFSHQQYEETKMQDLTAILFGDELHAVTVTFNGSDKRYTYKSVQAVEVGSLVVVDTPSNGYQVVRVVACKKGLDKSASFEMYKWLVGVVNEAEYRRLIDVEKDFVRKAKEEQAKQAAIKKLQELGVSADEYRAAVLGL